ncbi:MAG TPA: MFS transporter [Xanthobacteraceae bacterium]|jgi:MFS family permease
MTQAISIPAGRSSEMRFVAPICAAHFISHYYMIILAPLFAFIRDDFGVSYTDLGLALTAFNLVSAIFQTPAGFLVDRIGARAVLVAGVALGAAAFAVAGLVHSFPMFIVMFGVAGLANTAYHPADYSLLSHYGSPARLGQIFSFHTFAGILGGAVAPAALLAMHSFFGWRGAFIGSAILGFLVLACLIAYWPALADHTAAKKRPASADADGSPTPARDHGWRLLFSTPIVVSLCFFVLLSLMGGLSNFLIVALAALYGTPSALANVSLTGALLFSALGVLAGGLLAARTTRHAAIAALGLALAGAVTALVGLIDFSPYLLVLMMSLSGLFGGIASPSRDMLVRAATPPGAFGRVFGFVSSGFNIGSMIAPTIYGMMLDHGSPRSVFLFSAACSIVCIATVLFGFGGRQRETGIAAAIRH